MDGLATARSETVEGLKKLIPAEDVSLYDSEKWHSFTFSKFLIVATPQSDMETFRDYCRDKFVMFDHGHGAFEVTQKKYSKATGIQFLLDHLGLPLENSFAFGDSNNDLPMLQYAGNSIAMGNCVEEILPFCTYQTTHINDNGIYNALSHFGLLG